VHVRTYVQEYVRTKIEQPLRELSHLAWNFKTGRFNKLDYKQIFHRKIIWNLKKKNC